jgi:hypothetical protein
VPSKLNEISADSLIQTARTKTALSDLGADYWDEPLKVLIQSVKDEARLSPFGEMIFKEKMVGQLVNRLRAIDWLKKKPEILDQELLPITLITGLQRTGTTRLQRLLSQQKGSRGLYTWEALNPSPIGQLDERSKRLSIAKTSAKAVKIMAPTFNTIHPIIVNDVEEDILLLDLTFLSTTFEAILNIPSYSKWLEVNYKKEAYLFEVKLLKLLQYGGNHKRWVLKSPHHLEYLKLVQETLNPEHVVWTHRSIHKSVPSLLSMIFYSRGLFTTQPNTEEIAEQWITKMKTMINKGMEFSQSNDSNIHHLFFDHWTQNETETVSDLFNISHNDVLLKEQNYSSRHHYNLNDFNRTEEDIDQLFEPYIQFSQALQK